MVWSITPVYYPLPGLSVEDSSIACHEFVKKKLGFFQPKRHMT